MAYNKTTWANGDIITAEKLNNLEDGVKSNENGYSVTTEEIVRIEETTFTPENNEYYILNTFFEDDNIKVILDGVEYNCEKLVDGNFYYGDYDLVKYPFTITCDSDSSYVSIFLADSNEHTIKVLATTTTVQVADDFKTAIDSLTKDVMIWVSPKQNLTIPAGGVTFVSSTRKNIQLKVDGSNTYLTDEEAIELFNNVKYCFIETLDTQSYSNATTFTVCNSLLSQQYDIRFSIFNIGTADSTQYTAGVSIAKLRLVLNDE